MREIYSNPEHARVGYFHSILEGAGIEAFIRNQYDNNNLTGVVFAPVLCITHDEDYETALELLKHTVQPAPVVAEAEWVCPKCNELVPGGFELCWSCDGERPGLLS